MAPYKKTILSLANSRRLGGTCFAGKEYAEGKASQWLRPINSIYGGAISAQDRLYEDKSHADVLDIVDVTLTEPKPHLHHQEDHQIKDDEYWVKVGRATWKDVVGATDIVKGPLWTNGDSSFHGLNDKVSEASVTRLKNSLYLIEPADLKLVVGSESKFGGGSERRVRARFRHNNMSYNFVVTDEPIEQMYFAKEDGSYKVENVRLCVSLAELLHGSATKLVAAVITPDRV